MGLRKLAHPALAEIQAPDFEFGDVGGRVSLPLLVNSQSPCKSVFSMDVIVSLAQDYAKHLGAPAPRLAVQGSPYEMMAALSLALYMTSKAPSAVTFVSDLSNARAQQKVHAILSAWREWQDTSKGEGRELVWSTNRLDRISCACMALQYAVSQNHTKGLMRRTHALSWFKHGHQLRRASSHEAPSFKLSLSSLTAIEAAVHDARKSRRVVVGIAASSSRIGGALLSGGHHGPEEEACMRSGLFFSLQAAADQVHNKHLLGSTSCDSHIPEDGVVISSDVKVFREGANKDYALLHSPVELAGMLSYSVPQHLGSDPVAEFQLFRRKFEALVHATNIVGGNVLVLSHVDCKHTAESTTGMMAKALGEALMVARGEIEEVVLTGFPQSFVTAVWSESGKHGDLPCLAKPCILPYAQDR